MFRTKRYSRFRNDDPNEVRAGLTFKDLAAELDAVFDFANETTRTFVQKTYWRCLLPGIMAPAGPKKLRWLRGAGKFHGIYPYNKQYIWDTCFALDALRMLPSQKQAVREVLGTFWDNQRRWNQNAFDCARGMIGHGYCPDEPDDKLPHHSCNPIIAWAVERIFDHTGDTELARESLEPLEQFHDWYWRERDLKGIGLIGYGSYLEDDVQGARNEQGYDCSCDTDELEMTAHPARPDGLRHYSNLIGVAPTGYVLHAERCLARLARKLGDEKMAARREQKIQPCVSAARKNLWDENAGTFKNAFVTGGRVETAAIGSWVPLMAEIPTRKQADRMIEVLSTPEWMTPLPVPTVGRTDPKWEPGSTGFLPDPPKKLDHLGQAYNFWRGDVWPPTNYHVAIGLKTFGADKLAERICDATIMNAIQYDDVNERYDCDTGEPLGVSDLPMSAATISMLLDGMTGKYGARVKKT